MFFVSGDLYPDDHPDLIAWRRENCRCFRDAAGSQVFKPTCKCFVGSLDSQNVTLRPKPVESKNVKLRAKSTPQETSVRLITPTPFVFDPLPVEDSDEEMDSDVNNSEDNQGDDGKDDGKDGDGEGGKDDDGNEDRDSDGDGGREDDGNQGRDNDGEGGREDDGNQGRDNDGSKDENNASDCTPVLLDSQQQEVLMSPIKFPIQKPKNYQSHGDTIWTNPKMNSAERARPWAVIAEKETDETVSRVMSEIMDPQTKSAMSNPLLFIASETVVTVISCEVKLKMADGKLWTALTGRGGAECHMGKCSSQDIHNVDRVKDGFYLDHDLDDIKKIIKELSDEDGDILTERDDFDVRFGQTGVNLTEQDVTDSMSVLHLKIAWFAMANELIIRHCSKVLKHNSGPLGSLKDHLETFRNEWMSSLGTVIGFNWEKKPNLTGHHFERMFSPKNREAIIDLLSRQPVWMRRWRRGMFESEKSFFR